MNHRFEKSAPDRLSANINEATPAQHSATKHRVHRLAALTITALITGSALQALVCAAPANAEATATAKARTQRMSDANLGSQQNGWYNPGDQLTLVCSKRGQKVKGFFSFNIPGGWDDLWYKTSDNNFVADVDIETGTLNVVAADCGTLQGEGQPQPQQSSAKEDRAIAWANGQVGSDAYPILCGQFVANAYGKPELGVGSALALHDQLANAGQIHMDQNFPKGALVFSHSSWDTIDGVTYGHVLLARGDGTFVSGGVSKSIGNRHTVQILNSWNPAGGAQYLGWAYPPADWPGV
jgi:hypothetical protein